MGKESQRLKPISIASMRRVAKSDIRLSDGTFISQGSSLMVLSDRHWDEELYHRARNGTATASSEGLRQHPIKPVQPILLQPAPNILALGMDFTRVRAAFLQHT